MALEGIVLSGMTVAAVTAKQDGVAKPARRFEVSAEMSVVSDYRRGGVTQSDHAPALQGRLTLRNGPWSAGAFATSMHGRRGSNAQVALFGSRRFEFGETQLTLGATEVIFIGGDADPLTIAQASVSRPLGPIDGTVSFAYAPEQTATHHEDGVNFNVQARTPVGRVGNIPLTGAVNVGWSEGEFAMGAGTKLDWSISATAEIEDIELGVAYVDNNLDDHRGDAGLIISITRRF